MKKDTNGHILPLILAMLPLIGVFVWLTHDNPHDTELSAHPSGIVVDDERPGVFRPMQMATPPDGSGTASLDQDVAVPAQNHEPSNNDETAEGSGAASSDQDVIVPTMDEPSNDDGQALLQTHCSGCHDLDPTLYTVDDWERWVREMAAFVDLSDDQLLAIESLVLPDPQSDTSPSN